MRTVFFDFDGVLCFDRFYKSIKKKYPEVFRFIQENVFNTEMIDGWMRNEINSNDVNLLISKKTGIDFDELDSLFIKDVEEMDLDLRPVSFFKERVLVTNNMDVFSEVTKKRLKKVFPFMFNSADYGVLKTEGLFDIVLKELNLKYEDVLLIDNSERIGRFFKQKGGQFYLYKTYEEFESSAIIKKYAKHN